MKGRTWKIERKSLEFIVPNEEGDSQQSKLSTKIHKCVKGMMERSINQILREVRRIVKEEENTVKEIREQAYKLEKETREELKRNEERAELDAQIRRMENYFKGLEEISSQIKEELEAELMPKIIETTREKIQAAFKRVNDIYKKGKEKRGKEEKDGL